MDLLFVRYADPFSLLDGYIQTSRFCEFINVLCKRKDRDDRWEVYLHKVWDKSFAEFNESLNVTQAQQRMTEFDVETTVKTSMDILGNFNPELEEGDL